MTSIGRTLVGRMHDRAALTLIKGLGRRLGIKFIVFLSQFSNPGIDIPLLLTKAPVFFSFSMGSLEDGETYRLAFPDHANPPYTHVSYGLPFQRACSKHVSDTFKAKRAYIIASTSLSKNTGYVRDLEESLGDRHAGTWVGIRPHTPWDDLVPIVNDMRMKNADLLITLGGGSLTDGAKIIIYALANNVKTTEDLEILVEQAKEELEAELKHARDRSEGNEPTVPIICIPTTLSAGE